jgi:hypothetical protein
MRTDIVFYGGVASIVVLVSIFFGWSYFFLCADLHPNRCSHPGEILILLALAGVIILMSLWFGWQYLFLSVAFALGWLARGWLSDDEENW